MQHYAAICHKLLDLNIQLGTQSNTSTTNISWKYTSLCVHPDVLWQCFVLMLVVNNAWMLQCYAAVPFFKRTSGYFVSANHQAAQKIQRRAKPRFEGMPLLRIFRGYVHIMMYAIQQIVSSRPHAITLPLVSLNSPLLSRHTRHGLAARCHRLCHIYAQKWRARTPCFKRKRYAGFCGYFLHTKKYWLVGQAWLPHPKDMH